MKPTTVLLAAAMSICSTQASATWQSTSPNNDYLIALDNGVVYISHPQFVAPCLSSRVEIGTSLPYSNDYTKRLTAAIFMAKAAAKNVAFTWDNATAPNCRLNSVSISN